MKTKDQQLLEEAYQQINAKKYKQTRLSQIVSVINESDYSINDREKLLKYVSENADSVIELCEQGGWDRFKKTIKTKVAPYALAATAALGGLHGTSQAAEAPAPNQTVITQNIKQTQDNPLNNWISELEMWKKIFSSPGGESSLDEKSFQQLIDGLKNMSSKDKEWYNSLSTSTKLPGQFRPNQSKFGLKADARTHILKAARFLDTHVRNNPAGNFAKTILSLTNNTTPEKLQEIYNNFGGKEVNKTSAHLDSQRDISYIINVLRGAPQQ